MVEIREQCNSIMHRSNDRNDQLTDNSTERTSLYCFDSQSGNIPVNKTRIMLGMASRGLLPSCS